MFFAQIIFILTLIISIKANHDIFLDTKFHTGFIPITETSDIFFWFFPS